MGVPEGNGPLEAECPGALENIRSGIDQFRFRDEGFFIGGPVAPLKADGAFSRSRGAYFQTHGHAFFHPFPFLGAAARSRLSTSTRSGWPWKVLARRVRASSSQWSRMARRLSSLGVTGMMTICWERRGAGRRPVVVGVHHDERSDHAGGNAPGACPCNCWVLSLPAKQMFWDLEKFCPRRWEVPACSPLRSCTMASTV